MARLRIGLGLVGIGLALYGLLLLFERPEDFVGIGVWLMGGVLLHDALLAPLVIVICLLGSRLLPERFQTPAVMTLAIFGTLSLIAIPVLGQFGAKPDNPTLLDRDYFVGWLALGALTMAGAMIAGALQHRRDLAMQSIEPGSDESEET